MSAIDFMKLMKQERAKATAKAAAAATTTLPTTPPSTKTLADYQLHNFPISDVFYIPNFFTETEEQALLAASYTLPQWSSLAHRRLQHFGGVPHASGMVPEELPTFIHDVFQKIQAIQGFPANYPPNHVLLNEYTPPHGKISPHKDGSLYYNSVSILSMKSPAVFEFFEQRESSHPIASILVMPRSLFVFRKDAYTSYYHGIRPREKIVICRNNVRNDMNDVRNDMNDVSNNKNDMNDTNDMNERRKTEAKVNLQKMVEVKQVPKQNNLRQDVDMMLYVSKNDSVQTCVTSHGEKARKTQGETKTETSLLPMTFQDYFMKNENENITITSCSRSKRVSFTVRHVLNVVDRELIENDAGRDERDRRTRVFLQGASDDV